MVEVWNRRFFGRRNASIQARQAHGPDFTRGRLARTARLQEGQTPLQVRPSDLIPSAILIARYFAAERDAITSVESEIAAIEQQLDERKEEEDGEEGLLAEAFEREAGSIRFSTRGLRARLTEIGEDADYADERQALEEYAVLLDEQKAAKTHFKAPQEDLEAQLDAKYPTLTEVEIKTLVVDDKWLATLAVAVQRELDRVSQTLTGRIRQFAERPATPLPQLAEEVAAFASRVEEHLRKMGRYGNEAAL